MVYSFFKRFYPKVRTYIPDRNNEGYGVSFQGIDYARENDCRLIIALDCGIKADKEIEYAREKGIDIIICDHHRPSDTLPAATAVLDPKRPDCPYPFKELSGCGVGVKLIQAVCKSKGWNDKAVINSYLDLVAVSIGADINPPSSMKTASWLLWAQKLNSIPVRVSRRSTFSPKEDIQHLGRDLRHRPAYQHRRPHQPGASTR